MASITCPKCGRTSHNPHDVRERYCGACHVFIDSLLAFRVYVDGALVEERWLDPSSEIDEAGVVQAELCRAADLRGLPWRLEIFDPTEDTVVRLGSSEDGMRRPELIDLDDPAAVVARIAQLMGY